MNGPGLADRVGDKHLFDLKRHQGIEIVNAVEALRRITPIE